MALSNYDKYRSRSTEVSGGRFPSEWWADGPFTCTISNYLCQDEGCKGHLVVSCSCRGVKVLVMAVDALVTRLSMTLEKSPLTGDELYKSMLYRDLRRGLLQLGDRLSRTTLTAFVGIFPPMRPYLELVSKYGSQALLVALEDRVFSRLYGLPLTGRPTTGERYGLVEMTLADPNYLQGRLLAINQQRVERYRKHRGLELPSEKERYLLHSFPNGLTVSTSGGRVSLRRRRESSMVAGSIAAEDARNSKYIVVSYFMLLTNVGEALGYLLERIPDIRLC